MGEASCAWGSFQKSINKMSFVLEILGDCDWCEEMQTDDVQPDLSLVADMMSSHGFAKLGISLPLDLSATVNRCQNVQRFFYVKVALRHQITTSV